MVLWSFGLSTKEPFTIMLYPSPLALVLSVHTSPWHMVRHRNFIFSTHMHISLPIYAHQIFSDSDLVVFKWQPFCYFSLICCPAHTDSHRDFILHILVYLFFIFMHKRNSVTVTFFLKFIGIFLKSIYSLSKAFKLHVL